ncbi:MAG: gliding motility-associated C-terminal domain-containing protein, partial [Saprospiraceae bacterium]
AEVQGVLDCNNSVVTLIGNSNTSAITFLWTGSGVNANTSTTTTNQAGEYTLTVTATNGCTSSQTVTVNQNTDVPNISAEAQGVLDCNNPSVTLTGNTTTPNVTYLWEGQGISESTPIIEVTQAGTYTFSITTNNGCTADTTLIIAENNDFPNIEILSVDTLTCNTLLVTIDASNSNGNGILNYEWQDSNGIILGTNAILNTSLPGSYSLIVSDQNNGCSEITIVTVEQNIETPIANAGNNGILTCDVNEVTLDGSGSLGNNLFFQWVNAAQILIAEQAITQVTESGLYTLIVTDTESGCSAQSSVEIIPDDNLPSAIATINGTLTCTTNSVELDGSSSSTISGNINYEWTNNLGNIISVLENTTVATPGIYTLEITDGSNGCSTTSTIEVEENITQPIAEAGQNQTLICGQSELILDGTSSGDNLSYEWQNENGITIGTSAITFITSGGIYFLMVTDTINGCSATDEVEIIPDTNLPIVDAGNDETLTCDINQIILNGSGSSSGNNIQYQWQNSAGNIIATTPTTTVNIPDTYTLYVLDSSNNCQTQDQVVINENINEPTIFIDFISEQILTCNNSSLILDASGSLPIGNINYQWATNNGNILSGINSPNPEIGQSGIYTLIITNTINGCTNSESIEILENITPPIVAINSLENLTCTIEAIQINALGSSSNGDYLYSWSSNPSGGILSGANTLQPIVNQAGTYTLTIINNDNGCQNEAQILVNENTIPPLAVASSMEQFDCLTESITLSGQGSSVGIPFTYEWFGNTLIDNATTLSPTIYTPGNYTIVVTDNENGCTNTAEIFIAENENIPTSAIIEIVDPLCYGDQGSLTIISVEGGEAPYLYSIDGGQNFSTSNYFPNLVGGNYTVLIQDVAGCQWEDEVLIEPILSELYVQLAPDEYLELGDNYQLLAFTNIDTSQIAQINWSPSDGLSCTNCLNPIIENIVNEIEYTITVVSDDGCKASDQIVLQVNPTKEIYIPNAFSPNDDGINDLFMIYANHAKVKQINTFQIYDRWGEQIFSAQNFIPNDPAFSWDGRFKTKQLNPAVFIYFAEIEFIDGKTELFKGDVTLIRD